MLHQLMRISQNPVNSRISLINIPGKLDIVPLVSLLENEAEECPRVIIFENSLVDCGYRYLEFMQALKKDPRKISLVEVFHSQIPDSKQEEIAADLMNINGRIKFVIATSALSMGFDAAGIQYVIHSKMARTAEDFIQMIGRAGRSANLKAICIVFTHNKTRDMDGECLMYRDQNGTCRRIILSGTFKGVLKLHDNVYNDTCCDVCRPSQDPLIQRLRERNNKQRRSDVDMQPRRTVTKEDREFFAKALACQLTSYSDNRPFLDCELTEGVIKLLTNECGHIFNLEDIEGIVPGLSDRVKRDILVITNDIF